MACTTNENELMISLNKFLDAVRKTIIPILDDTYDLIACEKIRQMKNQMQNSHKKVAITHAQKVKNGLKVLR